MGDAAEKTPVSTEQKIAFFEDVFFNFTQKKAMQAFMIYVHIECVGKVLVV